MKDKYTRFFHEDDEKMVVNIYFSRETLEKMKTRKEKMKYIDDRFKMAKSSLMDTLGILRRR